MSCSRCCEICGKPQLIQKQVIHYGNMRYEQTQISEPHYDTYNFSVGKDGYEPIDLELRTPYQEYVEPETCTTATQYSTSHLPHLTDSKVSMFDSWQNAENRLVTYISKDPNERYPDSPPPRKKKRNVKCKCSSRSTKKKTPIKCAYEPEPELEPVPEPEPETAPEPPKDPIECCCPPPTCETMTSLQELEPVGKFSWSQLGFKGYKSVICGCYVRKSQAMHNIRKWDYSKRDPYMTKIICKCKPPKARQQTIQKPVEIESKPEPKKPVVKQPVVVKEKKVKEPVQKIETKEPEIKQPKPKPKQPKPKKVEPKVEKVKPVKKPAETKKPKEKPKPIPPRKKVTFNFDGVLLKERRCVTPEPKCCRCCCPLNSLPRCCFFNKCDVCPYYSYVCYQLIES